MESLKIDEIIKEYDLSHAAWLNQCAMWGSMTAHAEWIKKRDALVELFSREREEKEKIREERDMWLRKAGENGKFYMDELHMSESLRTEISAKDKVLEWYADEKKYVVFTYEPHIKQRPVLFDNGEKARSILSQYGDTHE